MPAHKGRERRLIALPRESSKQLSVGEVAERDGACYFAKVVNDGS
jgi:hypothetical protein